MFKINRILWALRKISLPIEGSALVLDVGAGGNPYPRADVLLDRLTGDEHRCGESMMIDRPVVFGDASRMPFKDKAFDFVIASHILEHMAEPEVFLKELQRVGKAGYIETPNAIFERLNPYHIHCLEVIEKDGVLRIHKKRQGVEDPFLGTKSMLADESPWGKHMFDNPQDFHVRYLWNSEIKFEIENPEVSCTWIEKINAESEVGQVKSSYLTDESGWRSWGLAMLNRWHIRKRNKRLKSLDLLSILACPACGGSLQENEEVLGCQGCNAQYAFEGKRPDFTVNLVQAAGCSKAKP